jgi:ankyrin repeat protein
MNPVDFSSEPRQRQLAIAVDNGDEAAIAAAIKVGGDVNASGTGGFRLLYWAMARGNAKGFEALLKHGAALDADYREPQYLPDLSYRETVLERAIAAPDTKFLEAAFRQGLDPNHEPHPKDGRTLLFIAVYRHSIPAIKALIAAGAELDRQEVSGYTPLVEARMGRNYNEAWVLLENGADPTIRDDIGHDFAWGLKEYGSRGVRPDNQESFEAIVAELVKRGLLTRQDIVEADKPKRSALDDGPPGVTVIEHAPDSEAGQAILEMDRKEREANERDRR